MPGSVSIAAFHGRKDMDEAFCFSGFRKELLDTVIFAEGMEFTDELNFNSVFRGNLLRILPDLFCKGLGEIGIIKNADAVALHICGHSIVMTPVWDISLYDHAGIAGNDTINFFYYTFYNGI